VQRFDNDSEYVDETPSPNIPVPVDPFDVTICCLDHDKRQFALPPAVGC
jgi:hypothetical protein